MPFFLLRLLKILLTIFAAVFMMNEPLISICVPAYKQPGYVARVLESVLQQDYKNVEIIISDDSPDEDTKQACWDNRSTVSGRYRPSL